MSTNSSNEEDGSESEDVNTPGWEDYFPYGSPYASQKDGIKKVLEAGRENGFALIEGACGTGKTLMALSAGLELVRNPNTRYERIFCMTSVKQQLRAFEDDIETINENLDSSIRPVSALTLVGKADLCSYVDADYLTSGNIYDHCDSLRDDVRRPLSRAESDDEEISILHDMVSDWRDERGTLEEDGWKATYGSADPREDDSPPGCPFYAKYRAEKKKTDEAVMYPRETNRPEDLMQKASSKGMCPHAVMTDAFDAAEVIIGNYRHAFDDRTVEAMTHAVIDDSTLVVCDEAHTIEGVVRDLLTETISIYSLKRAAKEIENFVLNPTEKLESASDTIRIEMAAELSVSLEEAKEAAKELLKLIEATLDRLDSYAQQALNEEMGNWRRKLRSSGIPDVPDKIEYPLRDPEDPQVDDLTEELQSFDAWESARAIGNAIASGFEEANKTHANIDRTQTSSDAVGRVLDRWANEGHTDHFREVTLDIREDRFSNPEYEWEAVYRGKLELKNCIPSSQIAATLGAFGGGVLMSATLEPFDVFKSVTGLTAIEEEREVVEGSYGINFPDDNRASYIVDAPKYTYRNRGGASDKYSNRSDKQERVRDTYDKIITDVVKTTPGNVLVCMPSYSEANWAGWRLRKDNSVNKDVLIDESSSNAETEGLKSKFFRGGGKVLTTSMRGTLTEGVDYDGEKLDACVVCGIPIRNTNSPHATAIQTAYEEWYGDKGFIYAFGFPAIRKARQAIGRVIRNGDDVGVRVLADGRYLKGYPKKGIPSHQRSEFNTASPDQLDERLRAFWRRVKRY